MDCHHHETFWTLLQDPAHWAFEIFLMILFDGLLGLLIWPAFRKWVLHHNSDDEKIANLEFRLAKLEQASAQRPAEPVLKLDATLDEPVS